MNSVSSTSPLVSVVMAVFNGTAYLRQAIESALGQTYSHLELIIVDDCSTDNSVAVVENYLTDARVKLVRNERNGGVAAARNRALGLAKGELIAFLDQDDIWLPRKLELQVAALRAHPEVGLMHANYARIDPEGRLLAHYHDLPAERFGNPGAAVDVHDVFAEIFISNDIQPLTTVIPRSVLETVGLFDPELPGVDDYELWLRIALRYPVGRVDTILGYWRAHPGQQSNRGHRMLMIRLEALDRFLRRFPEASLRVPAGVLRKRMHRMCHSAANYTMYHLRDYPAARALFGRTVAYRPLDVDSWGKYAYCALPARVRDTLKKIKSAFKPLPPASS